PLSPCSRLAPLPYTTLFRSNLRGGTPQDECRCVSPLYCFQKHRVRATLGLDRNKLSLNPQKGRHPLSPALRQVEDECSLEPDYQDRKITRLNSSHVSISFAV